MNKHYKNNNKAHSSQIVSDNEIDTEMLLKFKSEIELEKWNKEINNFDYDGFFRDKRLVQLC